MESAGNCIDCGKLIYRRSVKGPIPKRCLECSEIRIKNQKKRA